MKFAVYVEGKAEMLFVADVLSKYSNYDSQVVGFQCINLNADDFEYVQYPFQGDENSETYYQIVNVNNDNRRDSRLLSDFEMCLVLITILSAASSKSLIVS